MIGAVSSSAIVALLGREDQPTDGVRDFVHLLGAAVEARGRSFLVERLPPAAGPARERLRMLTGRHPGAWFVLQYTALQWSRRAVPVRVPGLLRTIRAQGGRAGIVFHDIAPYDGTRVIDYVRRTVQRATMRRALAATDHAFVAGQHRPGRDVPAGFAGWAPALTAGLTFLPVGSVLPPLDAAQQGRPQPRATRPGGAARIGVFGVTDGRDAIEVGQIADVLRLAQARLGPLEFVAFGRGSDRARERFRAQLPDTIPVRALGVVPPDALLAEAVELDALLFVRHHVSAQRSSAMAAVAAGVPVVGYQGALTTLPLSSWGMRLVPEGDVPALANALVDVVGDAALWRQLRDANLRAYADHIAWDHIADRFLDGLRP